MLAYWKHLMQEFGFRKLMGSSIQYEADGYADITHRIAQIDRYSLEKDKWIVGLSIGLLNDYDVSGDIPYQLILNVSLDMDDVYSIFWHMYHPWGEDEKALLRETFINCALPWLERMSTPATLIPYLEECLLSGIVVDSPRKDIPLPPPDGRKVSFWDLLFKRTKPVQPPAPRVVTPYNYHLYLATVYKHTGNTEAGCKHLYEYYKYYKTINYLNGFGIAVIKR